MWMCVFVNLINIIVKKYLDIITFSVLFKTFLRKCCFF